MPDKNITIFDETKLREEIVRVWGEYGAHAEVYDHLLAELARVKAQRDALAEALRRISDRRMWRYQTGECGPVWYGETADGNELETEDPIGIARAALAALESAK